MKKQLSIALMVVIFLCSAFGVRAQAPVNSMYESARAALKAGDYAKCRVICHAILAENPQADSARQLIEAANEAEARAAAPEKAAALRWFAGTGGRTSFFAHYYPARHLVYTEAGAKHRSGTYMLRFNQRWLGDRYAWQVEADAYPKLGKGRYLYLNLGASPYSLFPYLRAGAEFFTSLPASFEASAGARYLDFTHRNLLVFTVSGAKYYKNWWFFTRLYLTPRDAAVAHSVYGGFRYYYRTAEDYFALTLGAGENPELLNQLEFVEADELLRNYSANFSIQHAISPRLIAGAGLRGACRETPFDDPAYTWQYGFNVKLKYYFK